MPRFHIGLINSIICGFFASGVSLLHLSLLYALEGTPWIGLCLKIYFNYGTKFYTLSGTIQLNSAMKKLEIIISNFIQEVESYLKKEHFLSDLALRTKNQMGEVKNKGGIAFGLWAGCFQKAVLLIIHSSKSGLINSFNLCPKVQDLFILETETNLNFIYVFLLLLKS